METQENEKIRELSIAGIVAAFMVDFYENVKLSDKGKSANS